MKGMRMGRHAVVFRCLETGFGKINCDLLEATD